MTPEERSWSAWGAGTREVAAAIREQKSGDAAIDCDAIMVRHVAAAIREAVAGVSIPQLKPFNANSYRAMAESIDEYKGWTPPISFDICCDVGVVVSPVFTLTDGVLSPDPGDEQPPPIDYANRPPRGGYF